MKTNIIWITAWTILLLGSSAYAQQTNRLPAEKAKSEARGLKQQLSLTEEQAATCEQIIKKYASQFAAIKKDKNDTTKIYSTKQQLAQQRDAEIKAVLTPNQAANFEKWKQSRKNHGVNAR